MARWHRHSSRGASLLLPLLLLPLLAWVGCAFAFTFVPSGVTVPSSSRARATPTVRTTTTTRTTTTRLYAATLTRSRPRRRDLQVGE